MDKRTFFQKLCGKSRQPVVSDRSTTALNEFRKYFVDTMVPEWQSQYLDFDAIVSLLHQAILEKDDEEVGSVLGNELIMSVESDIETTEKTQLIHRNNFSPMNMGSINSIDGTPSNVTVFSLLGDEYHKINNFYTQIETQLRDRMDEIEKEATLLDVNSRTDEDLVENVAQAFVELYKGLQMLYSYSTLNHTAVYEILKIYEQLKYPGQADSAESPLAPLTATFSSPKMEENAYYQRHMSNDYHHRMMLAQHQNSNIVIQNQHVPGPLLDLEEEKSINTQTTNSLSNSDYNNNDNHMDIPSNDGSSSGSPLNSMQIHYATLNAQYFNLSLSTINELISKVEKMYCKTFDTSLEAARKFLSRPQKKLSQKAVFGLGFWCGFDLALSIVLILLFVWDTDDFNSKVFFAAFPIYRGIAQVLLVIWCFGILVFIWTKYRINYIFVLGLNPPSSLGHPQIFKMAALATAIWLTSFLLFTIGTKIGFSLIGISHNLYPLVMLIVYAVVLLCPFHMFYRSTRIWLGKTIWQCFIAPITEGAFVHFYVADIMTSMPKFFSDAEYIICYYTTGDWRYSESARCTLWCYRYLLPYTMAFPLLIRFIQCIRRLIVTRDKEHAANAGKYFSSMSVSVFGAFNGFQVYSPSWQATRIMWFISFVTATIYLYVWDVLMDWGLGQPKQRSGYFMLRNNLVFKPYVYYIIMFMDVLGRFTWTWALSEVPIPGLNSVYIPLVFAGIEICRRSMWGVIRVENEHLKNCIKYRAMRDINILKGKNSSAEKRSHGGMQVDIKQQ